MPTPCLINVLIYSINLVFSLYIYNKKGIATYG